MTITSRGWLNIILFALGAASAIIVLLSIQKCTGPKPDVIAFADSTQYYKDKLGHEVAAIKQRDEDYFKVTSAGYLDSIAKLHNSKAALIQEVITLKQKGAVTITVATPPTIIKSVDTIPGQCPDLISAQQAFSSPYYYADVTIALNNRDSSRMSLQTVDTLSIVAKTVKEGGLFNSKTYLQIDATNANPDNHITGLQVYRKLLPKAKKFGIGPFVGYGVSGNALLKPNILVGVSVQYNFIRF